MGNLHIVPDDVCALAAIRRRARLGMGIALLEDRRHARIRCDSELWRKHDVQSYLSSGRWLGTRPSLAKALEASSRSLRRASRSPLPHTATEGSSIRRLSSAKKVNEQRFAVDMLAKVKVTAEKMGVGVNAQHIPNQWRQQRSWRRPASRMQSHCNVLAWPTRNQPTVPRQPDRRRSGAQPGAGSRRALTGFRFPAPSFVAMRTCPV